MPRFLIIILLIFLASCNGGDTEAVDDFLGTDNSEDDFSNFGNASISFTPSPIDFGSLVSGNTSSNKTMIARNISSSDLHISNVSTNSNQFNLVSDNCPRSPAVLSKNVSCTMTINFSPTSVGSLSSAIDISFGLTGSSTSTYTASGSVWGTSVTPLSFTGLDSICGQTHNSMTLCWTSDSSATIYQVYDVTSGSMVWSKNVDNSSGNANTTTVTGLSPSTSYTWRVRAIDSTGTAETNTTDKSATTSANQSPTLSPIADFIAYGGVTVTSIDAEDSNSGGDTDIDGDALTYSCLYDTTNNGSMDSGGTNCTSLSNQGGANPSFNSSTGVLAGWIPLHSEAGSVDYEFLITATDPYGATATDYIVVDIQAGVPILTSPSDAIFPSNAIVQGGVASFDIDNSRSNDDSGMTYTCVWDRVVDGTVAGGASCTTLPNSATFNTATGEFSWTTDANSWGPYEILVTGTNTPGSDTEIILIDVKQSYVTGSLDYYFDAQFATTDGGQGTNSTFTDPWTDLVGTLGSTIGDLLNFAETTSSGWAGSVTNAVSTAHSSPYNLTFDGVNDQVNFGNLLNGSTSVLFDMWIKPSSVTSKGAVILTNGDTAQKGFTLRQSHNGLGNIEILLGSKTIVDEILADSPITYYRMGDNYGGNTIYDWSGNNNHATITGLPAMQESGAGESDSNGAITWNGTSSMYAAADGDALNITTAFTVESFVKHNGSDAQGIWVRNGQFTMQNNNTTTMDQYVRIGSSWIKRSCATNLTSANYVHYVGRWDGSSLECLSNGTATGSPTAASGAIGWGDGGNHSLYLGRYAGGGSFYAAGGQDEVAIFNTSLSDVRIQAHYNAKDNVVCESKTRLVDDQWYHVAGAIDGLADEIKLYINGVEECLVTVPAGVSMSGSGVDLYAGTDASSDNDWTGSIADLRFYSDTSATTVASNLSATLPRFYAGAKFPVSNVNLEAWYKADAIYHPSPGRLIGRWEDLSGNNAHLNQTTASDKPTYVTNAANGYPAVRFDGTNSYLGGVLASSLDDSFTIFTVAYFDQASQPSNNYDYFFTVGPLVTNQVYTLARSASNGACGANMPYTYNNSTVMCGTSVLTGQTWIITTSVVSGSAPYHAVYENGTNLNMAAHPSSMSVGTTLELGRWRNDTHLLDGDIAEFIVVNETLGDSEREEVQCYLSQKYNISVSHTCP